jgi:hypothetical protein
MRELVLAVSDTQEQSLALCLTGWKTCVALLQISCPVQIPAAAGTVLWGTHDTGCTALYNAVTLCLHDHA